MIIRKEIIIVIFLGIVILILLLFLALPKEQKSQDQDQNHNLGIEIFYPQKNEIISSPLTITGKVSGNGWIGFEAQTGTVSLQDKNGNELAFGILTAKEEWMQKVIDFETTLSFVSLEEQDGQLIFHNENPTGESERDKIFILPVRFK
jgi:hypothetical protein